MTDTAPKLRPRTLLELQPFLFGYGAGISLFSPFATVYQQVKLNPVKCAGVTYGTMARLSAMVFVPQTFLKALQMNASTPVKEYINPWIAFGIVGILQGKIYVFFFPRCYVIYAHVFAGGVYGQSNMYFSKALELGKVFKLQGMFRGVAFAAVRDTISQGIPFMYSNWVRESLFIPTFFPPTENTLKTPDSESTVFLKKWVPVLFSSVVATVLSQSLHNCQMTMQADQEV